MHYGRCASGVWRRTIKKQGVKELWISDTLTSKSALIPWLCISWVFFFSFRNSIPVFGYQINTLTRVSSNKSNTTSSVSSGIQTPRSAGLKKRDAVKFFCELSAYRMKHGVECLTWFLKKFKAIIRKIVSKALFVFPHELLTCLRILRRLNKRAAE